MNNIRVILLILFAIAFVLRFYLLPENLFFGPEQGIDFSVIKNIAINHNLTLIGSKTDIAGIFHGPIYYYLAVIPFLISKGDPLFILTFFIIINCFAVFFIFLLGKELFNRQIGLLSASIFVVSYGAIVYSRWLSNPPLTIPLSCLFFLFIHKFLQGKKIFLLYTCIIFGLLGQAEFLNFLFFGVISILILLVFRNTIRKQNKLFLMFCVLFLIAFSTGNYLIFDFRHNFLISRSFLQLVQGNSGYYMSLGKSIVDNSVAFISAFTSFITPANGILSTGIFIMGMWIFIKDLQQSSKKYKYGVLILIWLLTPLVMLISLRHDVLPQFFVAIVPACIIITSVVIEHIRKERQYVGIFLLLLILGINIYSWVTNIPSNRNIFFQSTQLGLKFSDQKKVIDTTYKVADGKPFSFQSYTIPYWSQQGWEYLFWYYGKQKYGYEPIGIEEEKLFVIIQDDPSNKSFQENWIKTIVNKWGSLKNTFKYGILTVRELKTDKN